jgi:hypothetical protein
MTEVRVIGRFVPSQWQPETIQAEIKAHLPECCARERVSVRIPHEAAPDPAPANLEWHQDGGGPEGTTHHMVVWASEQPTELKTSDGELFTGEPLELVWFDNCRAWHKQPRGTNERRRWFVAIRCSGA